MEELKKLVRSHSGLKIEGSVLAQFNEKVKQWLERFGNSEENLIEYFKKNPALLNNFISEITINESFFFRHSYQFDTIGELLPEFRKKNSLSILSIGCANGCEPYSAAIYIREFCPDIFPKVSIKGVDINKDVINIAKSGRYMPWYLRHTSKDIVDKYFSLESREYTIDRTIKEKVEFSCSNFLDMGEKQKYDIILCRNFLIYFDEDKIEEIFHKLRKLSKDDTFIIFGNADILMVSKISFKRVNLNSGIAYQINKIPDIGDEHRQKDIKLFPDLNIRLNYDIKQTSARVKKDESEIFKNAVLQLKNEDYVKAADMFSDIVTNINPMNHRSKSFLAYCYLNMDRPHEALEMVNEVLDQNFNIYETHIVAGIIDIYTENYKEAVKDFRKAIYIKPDSEISWYYMGFAGEMEKDIEQAVKSYKRAYELLMSKNLDEIYPLTAGISKNMLLDFIKEKLKLLDSE